jgi:hypothetical protein
MEETNPNVTPIHDEAAEAFEAENKANLDAAQDSGMMASDETDDSDTMMAAEEVGEVVPDKPYGGNCTS